MNKFIGQVALVTGASAGIGRAIAIKLAEEGMNVAALARRENRLQELANSFKGKGSIKPYKCDVTDDEAVIKTFQDVKKTMGPIRVLINNAGIAPQSEFMDFEIDVWRNIFNVNVFAMFSCIKQLISYIKKRESKELVHIINVNSIAGQYVIPEAMVYTSSKHCVTLLTRALINQIAKDNLNVRVTSLSPGLVKSETMTTGRRDIDISKVPHLDVTDIANATVTALIVPENVIISELTIKPKGEVL